MDVSKLPNHVNIVLCVWLFSLTCVFSICFVSHRLEFLVKFPYTLSFGFPLFYFDFFIFLWARCKNIGRLELFVQTLYGNNRIDSLGFCIIKENWSCDQNLPKKASSNFVLLFHVFVGLLHISCELDETRVENTITRCSKIFSISLNIYIYIYICSN